MAGSTQAPHICIDLLDCIVELSKGINEDEHMEDTHKVCNLTSFDHKYKLFFLFTAPSLMSLGCEVGISENILKYAFLRAELSKRLTPPLLCNALLHARPKIRLTGLAVLCQEYHPISDEDIKQTFPMLQSLVLQAMQQTWQNRFVYRF